MGVMVVRRTSSEPEPLSDRARLLLRLIVQTTVRGGDGSVKRYWVPKNHSQFVGAMPVLFDKSDIAVLRDLTKRGLIERQKDAPTAHAYASSAAGEQVASEKEKSK
jgi:hypothetical protein